jgi:hypothetical protein
MRNFIFFLFLEGAEAVGRDVPVVIVSSEFVRTTITVNSPEEEGKGTNKTVEETQC